MLNKTASHPLAIYRGAPRALVLKRLVNGVYTGFPAGLTFRAKAKGAVLFHMAVGNGITLSAEGAVADAVATFLPTPAQSLLVPKGAFAAYEVVAGTPETIMFHGTLTGMEADS